MWLTRLTPRTVVFRTFLYGWKRTKYTFGRKRHVKDTVALIIKHIQMVETWIWSETKVNCVHFTNSSLYSTMAWLHSTIFHRYYAIMLSLQDEISSMTNSRAFSSMKFTQNRIPCSKITLPYNHCLCRNIWAKMLAKQCWKMKNLVNSHFILQFEKMSVVYYDSSNIIYVDVIKRPSFWLCRYIFTAFYSIYLPYYNAMRPDAFEYLWRFQPRTPKILSPRGPCPNGWTISST